MVLVIFYLEDIQNRIIRYILLVSIELYGYFSFRGGWEKVYSGSG